ncbi:hypothetical protein [Kitasatospora sp. NBC_00315]|uniref:hypothetical protein n=1 Tax=Kitasatospora sp. NBC_00315 TaxID=2975963 RepID=UPI00324333BD
MEIRGSRRVLLPALLLALAALAGVLTYLARSDGAEDRSRTAGPGRPAAAPQAVDLAARVAGYTAGFSASGPYTVPDAAQRRAVADGVGRLLDGRREEAGQTLARVGYRLTEFTEQESGRLVGEIAEAPGPGEAVHGWGRVYLDLSEQASWSVQVPHPVFDTDTELLGVEVFRATPGGVMVLAGAHRKAGADGSSDPAHRTDTVFAAVADALAGRGLPGVQLHGFDEGSLPGQDTVVSSGTAAAGPAARLTADGLEQAGFAVCRAWRDKCGHLEGTTNVEGRSAAALGVPWLHVELGNGLRTEPAQRAEVVTALSATVRSWAAAGTPSASALRPGR